MFVFSKSLQSFICSSFLVASSLFQPANAESVVVPKQKLFQTKLQQVPGFYRFEVGKTLVTAVFDGIFSFDTKLLKGKTEEELKPLLEKFFQNPPQVQTAVNAYAVHHEKGFALIDAGASNFFGPNTGFALKNLIAGGIKPSAVKYVFLTHMHPDHIGGLINEKGTKQFPNATVYVLKEENDFWLSAETKAKAPAEMQKMFEGIAKAAKPYADSKMWKTFSKGEEVLPGIIPQALPGHTVGHTGFKIKNESSSLFIIGDVIHNYASQFQDPTIAVEFDTNPAQAIETRKALLKEVSASGEFIAGMHLPFPGIGRIKAQGETYTWVPVEYSPLKN